MYEVLKDLRAIKKNNKHILAVIETREFQSLLKRQFDIPWYEKIMKRQYLDMLPFQRTTAT